MLLQRRTPALENNGPSDAPPIVHDALRSSGEPLDQATRAFFERRFTHNFSSVPNRAKIQQHAGSHLGIGPADDQFEREANHISAGVMQHPLPTTSRALAQPPVDLSQVRIHTGALASQSARAVNASAYTVGRDIVFGSGRYAPETSAGRSLLAHELVHVFQQSQQAATVAQRAPDEKKDLEDYATFLTSNKKIEGKPASKQKALQLIDFVIKAKTGPGVGDDDRYLLILELAAGKPSQADLDGILELLERMTSQGHEKLFQKGRVDVNKLAPLFTGKNKDRLEDFFNRRFEGGLVTVKAGQIKPIGERLEPGVPLASIQIIKDTIAWLKTNKKEAAAFFGDVWNNNKIVLLGEMHFVGNVQRQFAADMLASKGGKDVGLALEIDTDESAEVNYYIEHGKVPPDAKGWWINDPVYKKLLDSARATKTQVIAIDTHTTGSDRDEHMAGEVIKLGKSKSKILVYVGAVHVKEYASRTLGEKLSAEFGGNSYAIDISEVGGRSNIYFMMKAAFPAEKSIGFDIDASPLAKHPDLYLLKPSMGQTLDGYIYFASDTAYK